MVEETPKPFAETKFKLGFLNSKDATAIKVVKNEGWNTSSINFSIEQSQNSPELSKQRRYKREQSTI